MLNKILLNSFITNFFGYGNLESETYFIGMEEGGGDSELEIEKRLNTWKESGERTLVDVGEFSRSIGVGKFFDDKVVLQKTWSKLIKLILSANGDFQPSIQSVRNYQRDSLGRLKSNNALIELMPLPSPSIDKWLYSEITEEPFLRTREEYFSKIAPFRIEKIRSIIQKYKPKHVIFYSYSYLDYWKQIAGVELNELPDNEIYYGQNGNTKFIITKHPVSFVRKNYFEDVGKFLFSLK